MAKILFVVFMFVMIFPVYGKTIHLYDTGVLSRSYEVLHAPRMPSLSLVKESSKDKEVILLNRVQASDLGIELQPSSMGVIIVVGEIGDGYQIYWVSDKRHPPMPMPLGSGEVNYPVCNSKKTNKPCLIGNVIYK